MQEKIAEIIVALETCKALARSAEADAAPNRFGLVTPAWAPLNACRNWYPRTYPRFTEILRQLGASGLMALPTEADVSGPGREDVERYLQSATLDGPERFASSASPGTRACLRSPVGSRCTSISSSAIRCGWPGRWSRPTTGSRQAAGPRVPVTRLRGAGVDDQRGDRAELLRGPCER